MQTENIHILIDIKKQTKEKKQCKITIINHHNQGPRSSTKRISFITNSLNNKKEKKSNKKMGDQINNFDCNFPV